MKVLNHRKKCLNDRKCIQLSIISDLQYLIDLNRYLHDLTKLQNVLMINEMSILMLTVRMREQNLFVMLSGRVRCLQFLELRDVQIQLQKIVVHFVF